MAKKTADQLLEQIYDERFDRIDTTLDDIKELIVSKASAGSVFRLERRMKTLEDTHIPCATVQLVQKEVADMKKSLEPVLEATDGAVYFKKHPGQLKMAIIGGIVLLIVSAAGIVPSLVLWGRYNSDMKEKQKKELVLQHNLEQQGLPKK